MPTPNAGITDAERALSPTVTPLTTPPLEAVRQIVTTPPVTTDPRPALDRLAAVYEAAQRRNWIPLAGSAVPGRADTAFYIVLADVYSTDLNLGERDRAYRADFDLAVTAIEAAGLEWADSTLADHSEELRELEGQMTSAPVLAPLVGAATAYFERLERLPTKHVVVDLPATAIDAPATRIVVEDPATLRRREREALSAVDNPYLAILFRHPLRPTIFRELHLARDAETAASVLRSLFADAHRGINGLQHALYADRHRVWRYPPIVVGGLERLGLDGDESLVRCSLDVARLKSGGEWDTPLLVAGVALAAAGLALSGPAGWAIMAADFVVTGMTAYEKYLQARDDEFAFAASAFRTGAPFPAGEFSYGEAALHGAAALIVAVSLVRGLFQLLGRTHRLATPPGVLLRPKPPPSRRPPRGKPPGPHRDPGRRPPPAEGLQQRKVVGLDRPDTSLQDVISPEIRALGEDARGVGVDELDLRGARSNGGRKSGRRREKRPTTETPPQEPTDPRPPPGGGAASPRSWPHVMQRSENWCGAACGEMAARRLGVDVTQEQIVATGLMEPSDAVDHAVVPGGFHAKQLAEALEEVAPLPGRLWKGGQLPGNKAYTPDRLREVLRRFIESTDASVILRVHGGKHWIVVDEVTAEGLIAIRDPARRAPELVTADEVVAKTLTHQGVFSFPEK